MKELSSILIIAVLSLTVNSFSISQVTTVPAGAGPYATLNAAFSAINAGGVYSGAVITVTITFDLTETTTATLNGGVFSSCVIKPSGARTVTANINAAVIRLNGTNSVTIDGLNTAGNSLTLVNPNAGTNANGVEFVNGATNNTVRNVTCVGLGAAGASSGGRGFNFGQSAAATGGNNNNTVEDCTTNGFRRGIQNFGTDGNGVFGFYNSNNIIRRNKVKNFTSLGIFIGTVSRNSICEQNEIFYDVTVPNDAAGVRAISVQGQGSNIVRQNNIHSLSGTVAGGFIGIISIPVIVSAPLSNEPFTSVHISNNFVALENCLVTAPYIYGIFPTSNPSTVSYTSNVFNNSIRISGSSGTTAAVLTICLEQGQDGALLNDTARIYNNLCINERLDGDVTSLHIGSDLNPAAGLSLKADYNTVYAKDNTIRGWAAGYKGTLYNGQDGNSLYHDSTANAEIEQMTAFDNVHFVSNTDLHLAGKISGNMDAKNLPEITSDIDSDSRAITSTNLFTYRGADEHLPTGGAAWRKVRKTIILSFQGYTNPTLRVDKKTDGNVYCFENGVAYCGPRVDNAIIASTNQVKFILYAGDSIAGTTKYIGISGKNTIRTASGVPVSFASDTSTYNFTTSLSQAFGGNLFGTSAPFQLYQGDVNQDDIIDGSDGSDVDNDAANFVGGLRINTDVNFDQIVDGSDAAIVDNNAANFVSAVIPFGFPGTQLIQNGNDKNRKNTKRCKPLNILMNNKHNLGN
jgi:hypothetical protein